MLPGIEKHWRLTLFAPSFSIIDCDRVSPTIARVNCQDPRWAGRSLGLSKIGASLFMAGVINGVIDLAHFCLAHWIRNKAAGQWCVGELRCQAFY